MPKSRLDFWRTKLGANVERDARQHAELTEKGWTVLTLWECESRDTSTLLRFVRIIRKHLGDDKEQANSSNDHASAAG